MSKVICAEEIGILDLKQIVITFFRFVSENRVMSVSNSGEDF